MLLKQHTKNDAFWSKLKTLSLQKRNSEHVQYVNMTLYLPRFIFYILATIFLEGTFPLLSVFPNNDIYHLNFLFPSLVLLPPHVSPLCCLGRMEPEFYLIALHLP